MITVAASNSSQQSKQRADFVCSGSSDQAVINQAIAALPAGVGGLVHLAEGNYKIDGTINIDSDYIAFEGEGNGTYIYPQSPSVNMPAMLRVGVTKNVNYCLLRAFRMYGGYDQKMASGDAIQLRGSNHVLEHIYIRMAAVNGVNSASFDSSNVFELQFTDVLVRSSGTDCFVFTQQVSDSELIRCIAQGGQVPISDTDITLKPGAFGRYGFNIAGTNIKLSFCHAYFCTWGLYSTSWGLQVVGGEYETNQIGGIYQGNNSPRGNFEAIEFYDNVTNAIKLDTNVRMHRILGNSSRLGSRNRAPVNAFELNNSSQAIIGNNVIAQVMPGGNGVYLHGTSSQNLVQGNIIKPEADAPTGNGGNAVTMFDSASQNEIIANTLNGSIQELAGGAGTPSGNTVEDNNFFFPGAVVTLIGQGSAEDPIQVPWQPADNNLLMGTWDPGASPANTQLTAGVLYLVRLTAREALTVSRLWWNVFLAGAGASRGTFSGIYDSTGALVASSSDIGSSLTSTGPVAATLARSYTMYRGQFVWAAIVCNLATTQPSLSKGTGGDTIAEAGNVPVTQARFATNGAGLTALPAGITPSHNIFTAQTLWAGAS